MPLQGQNNVPQGQQKMCRPCGTSRLVVCRIVLPGFRPWRDVGMDDVRRAICDLRGTRGYPPRPRSCRGCKRFRRLLRSQRNGGGRRREQGEMGGEGKGSGNGTPQPAAHLPFFSPLAAHHSAKRGSVERNLPIYDLKSKVLRLHSPFFILHSQLPYILPTSCCRYA